MKASIRLTLDGLKQALRMARHGRSERAPAKQESGASRKQRSGKTRPVREKNDDRTRR